MKSTAQGLSPLVACSMCMLLLGCFHLRTAPMGSIAGRRAPAKYRVVETESPAAAQSAEPNLVAGDDGRLYLSWIETKSKNEHTLRFSVWTGNGWSAAKTIARGKYWFVNWADFPSLAVLKNGTLAAHWLVRSGPGTYSYDVHVSISRDGGETWSAPVTPHRDGVQAEHGFVSIVPLSSSRFGLFWLDGREMSGEHGHGEGDMTLRFTTLEADGQLGEERLVDGRVCECCQTSAVKTDSGDVLVVYRDRSETEVRDIGLARLSGDRFSKPAILHPDNWKIPGCPVNGPAISARGRVVAVAWYTMATDGAGHVRLAVSRDGGRSFETPISVDDGQPLGRVDTLILADGSVLVCWLENVEDESEIRVRHLRANGTIEKSISAAPTRRSRASGFPHVASAGNQVILAWTDAEDPPRVRTALLEQN